MLSALVILLSFPCHSNDRINFSGFGNIAAVHSNSDTYRFRTDISKNNDNFLDSFDFNAISSIGLQTDILLHSNFDFVGQLIYQGQEDVTFNNSLSLAFLRYKPTPNLELRVGRTLLDLYLLTEFRDINFAYPWAKIPTEVYGLLPYRSLDGIDATYFSAFEALDLRFKFFFGESTSLIALDNEQKELAIDNTMGISIELSQLNWTFSLKHTQAKTKHDIPTMTQIIGGLNQIPEQIWPDKSQFISDFSLVNKKLYFSSCGLKYSFGSVDLISELVNVGSDSSVIPTVKSGYAGITYNFDSAQLFYSFASVNSKVSEFTDALNFQRLLPTQVEAVILAVSESFRVFSPNQQTHSIGVRYDVRDNIAIKLQADHNNIDAQGGALWSYQGLGSDAPKESFTSLFLSVSFTF